MASPQNPPGPPQHPQQHTQPLMGQLGPSLHPPNSNQGMNPMNSQGPLAGAGAPPPMQYPQMGRSPSRAATPSQGQGGMMHPSPSMANRQPPSSMATSAESLNTQFMLLPQGIVANVSKLLGIELRDIASLSMQDKSRILDYCRNRSMQPQPQLGPGPAGLNQSRMGKAPSPALNGPPKDQKPPLMPGGPPGLGNTKNPMQNMPANHNSPRNPGVSGQPGSAAQTPNMGVNGIVPGRSTPVPGNVANINLTSTPVPGSMGGPPPSPPASVAGSLGDPGGGWPMSELVEGNLFSPEFIQIVAGLDVFDPRFLEPTGDINFERDFGQWFNPDDAMTGLDYAMTGLDDAMTGLDDAMTGLDMK